uniref:Uncharacterized protein n=1 Tax=Anguilla anguilla TaxID=7936 RepID=A0A0E9UVC6_ANGAN
MTSLFWEFVTEHSASTALRKC